MDSAQTERSWTDYDSCLWHTCRIVGAMLDGTVADLEVPPSTFAPKFDAQRELMLASGYFDLGWWGSPGNGSYQPSSGMLVATGRGGLALTAGYFGAQAWVNSRRRQQALADSVPRWLPIQQGVLHVSSHGFYMSSQSGLFPWDWRAIDDARMTGPGVLEFRGSSEQGQVHLQLVSHWSELCFALWAVARHPRHPQLAGAQWLPPGWVAWASAQGYHPPAVLPALGS